MRVLIIEQRYDGGHYLNYVQYLVQAFAPLGCEIVVAVPNAAPESAQFKMSSVAISIAIPAGIFSISRLRDKHVEDDLDRCARLSRFDRPCQAGCRVSSHALIGWPSHLRGGSPCVSRLSRTSLRGAPHWGCRPRTA